MKSGINKTIAFVVILCLVCFCIFCACGVIPYHAVLNSHANDLVDENFLEENRVRAYYPIVLDDENTEYIQDKNSPLTRTFVITERQEFDKIFTKSTTSVDFENQIVILYIFGDIYLREYYLEKIILNEDTLEISYKLEWSNKADAMMLYQRCFMLIMDKVSFIDVKFIAL